MSQIAPSVGVFWDIENIGVPKGFPPKVAAAMVTEFANTYGVVENKTAVIGRQHMVRTAAKNELFKQGFSVIHTTQHKESADKTIIVQLCMWVIDNLRKNPTAPPVVILISGDTDFQVGHQYNLIYIAVTLLFRGLASCATATESADHDNCGVQQSCR